MLAARASAARGLYMVVGALGVRAAAAAAATAVGWAAGCNQVVGWDGG
jgi:hypothetical protein